jgi:hypothetical protein
MASVSDGLSSTTKGDVMVQAEALASAGQFLEAIACATEANRHQRNPDLERKLVQWRHEAFATVDVSRRRPDWPPVYPDPFDGSRRPPEISPDQLTSETLGAGIQRYGSLLVRNLFSAEQAARLVQGIDQAFADCARHKDGYDETATTAWYHRCPLPEETVGEIERGWVEGAFGVLLADSPRLMYEYTEILNALGIVDTFEGYLGERPALSIGKTTLRRVPKTLQLTGWHQDLTTSSRKARMAPSSTGRLAMRWLIGSPRTPPSSARFSVRAMLCCSTNSCCTEPVFRPG